MITVTVPKSYSFISDLQDDIIWETEETFDITIERQTSGDYKVTGAYDNVLNFVEGITIDDEDSISSIMDTAV